jgi:hypothetical protein
MTKEVIAISAVGIFFAVAVCVLLGTIPDSPNPGPSGVPEPERNIYVTRTDHILNMEGKEVWILEYTVNGEIQGTLFNSQKAMTEYREYLDTIGTVYQRDPAGE